MDLDELRSRLTELDDQIIDLVAERQSIVDKVSAFKLSSDRATRDYEREKQVINGARERAAELGLPPDMAAQLMELLIRTSLSKQEQARVQAQGQGAGRPALVIGGAGGMGRWFVDFLQSQGYRVTVADPSGPVTGCDHAADWSETPDEFVVTVVAAPITVSAGIIDGLAEAGRSGLIFDVGSLKTPLTEALKRAAEAGLNIVSLHPMFGPDTSLLSGKHVLFMPVGPDAAVTEARALFDATMAEQTEISLAEHDRLIAFILGLSHALNIAFFDVLASSGEAIPRLAGLSSTTFDAQLDVASKVAAENPHLYYEIQSLNANGLEPLESLQASLQAIIDAVRSNDEETFVGTMRRGRDYLASRS